MAEDLEATLRNLANTGEKIGFLKAKQSVLRFNKLAIETAAGVYLDEDYKAGALDCSRKIIEWLEQEEKNLFGA